MWDDEYDGGLEVGGWSLVGCGNAGQVVRGNVESVTYNRGSYCCLSPYLVKTVEEEEEEDEEEEEEKD